jgi:hypothetical protein
MESVMIMMSRIEAEMRIRQRELLEEMQRERAAEDVKELPVVRVSGAPRVYSQFFGQRFGTIMSRLKLQFA